MPTTRLHATAHSTGSWRFSYLLPNLGKLWPGTCCTRSFHVRKTSIRSSILQLGIGSHSRLPHVSAGQEGEIPPAGGGTSGKEGLPPSITGAAECRSCHAERC